MIRLVAALIMSLCDVTVVVDSALADERSQFVSAIPPGDQYCRAMLYLDRVLPQIRGPHQPIGISNIVRNDALDAAMCIEELFNEGASRSQMVLPGRSLVLSCSWLTRNGQQYGDSIGNCAGVPRTGPRGYPALDFDQYDSTYTGQEHSSPKSPSSRTKEASTKPVATRQSTPTCATPDSPAHIVNAAMLDTPDAAKMAGQSGTTYIKVTIDSGGNMTSSAIFKSSGFPLLDNAALEAAQNSTYAPEIFHCKLRGGSFIYTGDFEPVTPDSTKP